MKYTYIFFVMKALRTMSTNVLRIIYTQMVMSVATTTIGISTIPTGNSPVTDNTRQAFPISPTGYYNSYEVPILNERSYGSNSPESNYDRLVYGVQNDGIIGYR